MKICFVCNEYPPAPHGGVGTFVATMVEVLQAAGHYVRVVGVYSGDAKPAIPGEQLNLLHRVPSSIIVKGRIGFFLNRLKLAQAVRRNAKTEQYDIIEAPEGGGWTAFFRVGCPVLIRLHSPAPHFALISRRSRGRLNRWAESRAIRRANAVAAVSRFVANQAVNLYPGAGLRREAIRVIYNGVNTEVFKAIPYELRDPGRILFAGTIKPQKGVETLLRAFGEIVRIGHGASLHIYGKDTQIDGASYLNSLLMSDWYSSAARGRTVYHGIKPQKEMSKEYGAASVCVFPSLAESFGFVAAEAMSCARPVVFSRTTSGPELIDDGATGLLCDPEQPSQIAGAIESMLTNPQRAAAIGQAAAASARGRFSIETCVEKTLTFYRECVAAFAR